MESDDSDLELAKNQDGSRKRRRTSPTMSRVQAKKSGVLQPVKSDSVSPIVKEPMSFASINVAPWLVASLASMEIKKPTGIQKACIPEILKGRDCIGGSRTGTGKTVAFAVPILQKWAQDPSGIYAVVITWVYH
jgi:ATP-dependent RNA helicase DDX49/DBP8